MVDEVARVGVGIVGNDRTGSAFKSVVQRAQQTQKRVGEINRRAINDNQRRTASSAKSIIGSMASVEKATARALGGRAISSALGGRLGALTEVASALGEGFAGASLAGTGLAATAGTVAVAVGGAAAVLGAAAYAAFKFADGWARGAAQLSRTAEIIGVSTKALTEFSAAAERAGVDKGAAVGTLGGLSQTLNDARYGRNTQALEVLRRLKVGMKLNKDGTVDTAAMLPAIANAIQRQNSSGRRTAAHALGIPDAALPAFSQGGKALKADMRDAYKKGQAFDDRVGGQARAADRKAVMSNQNIDAAKFKSGQRVSEAMSGRLADAREAATGAFNDVVRGDFKGASKKLGEAGTSLNKASETLGEKIWKHTDPILGRTAAMAQSARIWGSGGTPSFGSTQAKQAKTVLEFFMRKGWSKAASSGITANLLAESSFATNKPGDSGLAYGMAQWHPDRQANFKKVFGHDIRRSTWKEQLEFVDWELRNTHKKAGEALRNAGSAEEAGAAASRLYEAPKEADYEAAKRGDLAESIAQTPTAEPHPVKVEIKVENGKATSVKTTSGKGPKAAVSHAMVN